MPFSLLPLSTQALEWLAASQTPEEFVASAEPGAMPPSFVAERALRLEAEAPQKAIPTSYLIVRCEDSSFVGACGFKNQPGAGRVEVGYGVAPTARGQGAATAALRLLTTLAFTSGASEVLAEIVPSNEASTRVAQKAGFVHIGGRVDQDNEYVAQWVHRGGA